MSGYYSVSRRLNDPFHDLHPHSTGEPACSAFAWVDLIGMARWKDDANATRGVVPAASERFLAARWNWHRSKVQRFLDELEAAGRISREPQVGRKPGRIKICNYDAYQDPGSTTESTSRSMDRSTNRSKEEEVRSKKKNYSLEFEELWAIRRKGDKPKAFALYSRAVPSVVDHATIMAARRSHVTAASEPKYVKGLEPWIRGERWHEHGSTNGKAPTKRTGFFATDADYLPGGMWHVPTIAGAGDA